MLKSLLIKLSVEKPYFECLLKCHPEGWHFTSPIVNCFIRMEYKLALFSTQYSASIFSANLPDGLVLPEVVVLSYLGAEP